MNEKKKNGQEQNNISDMNLSINDKFNQIKVHDEYNINLHKKDTQHSSVNNDSEEYVFNY